MGNSRNFISEAHTRVKSHLVFDVAKNQTKFPVVSILLLVFFYLLGIILFSSPMLENGLASFTMDTYIISYPRTFELLTITNMFEFQWQVLTYFYIHFAVVHYGYSGFLLLYYLVGLEKATNGRLVLVVFILSGIFAPLTIGVILFLLKPVFGIVATGQGVKFLVQEFFLGSSVGIWGCIGFSFSVCRKRVFYAVPIVIFLFLEVLLKVAFGTGGGDITANIVHAFVFMAAYGISKLFCTFTNNERKSGELFSRKLYERERNENASADKSQPQGNFLSKLKISKKKEDWLLFGLMLLHSIPLFIHTFDSIGILPNSLFFYIFG